MAVQYAALSACRKLHVCHCNSLGGATWGSVTITGRTDRRTDRVRRNMRPPPREEGPHNNMMLEMVIFSTKISTINNYVIFQNFSGKKIVRIIAKFSINFCKLCLNRLTFRYFLSWNAQGYRFFFCNTLWFILRDHRSRKGPQAAVGSIAICLSVCLHASVFAL